MGRERWKVTVTDNAECIPPAPTKVANCGKTKTTHVLLSGFYKNFACMAAFRIRRSIRVSYRVITA